CGKQRRSWIYLSLQNKEFALGGTLTLKPAASPSSISSITWKHNDNLLAEQLNKESPPDYYPPTEKRISLNFKTGELSIIKLTEKDAGKYNVEINNVIQNVGYQVKIIKRVPVPTVVVQPLACSETSTDCSLDCHGDVTGAGTVRYFWKGDDGDWKESAKENKRDIKNDADTQKIKEFFCKVNNSVSDEESPATKNPFYKPETTSSAGMVAGISIPMIFLLLGAAGGVFGLHKKGILTCFRNRTDKTLHHSCGCCSSWKDPPLTVLLWMHEAVSCGNI
uniref:Ig-like domain-containing protein n=1 Tax=Oryzias sinensis TaxID=183150 RepID=A0A8C7XZJ5_9TELE